MGPRVTMLAADGAVALGSLLLAGLFLAESAGPTTVLAFLLWRAVGGAFHAPAWMSATTLLVPEEALGRVQGVNQMLQGGLAILAPALGALLLPLVGMTGLMALDVVTALVAIALLLVVRVPEPERRSEPAASWRAAFLADVAAGLRYLRGLPGHTALIGYAAVINLFLVPAFALLPLFVLQELRGSSATLAWVTSAFGAGVIGGGLALSLSGRSGGRMRTALASIAGLGAATLAFGLTPAWLPAMAVVSIFGIGAFSAAANGSIVAVLQTTIAPEYQGRVFTLLTSLAGAATPLGLLFATPLAEVAGVRAWYLAGGVVCAGSGIAAFLVRPIVRMEESAHLSR